MGLGLGLGSNCDWTVLSMKFKIYTNVPDVREWNCSLSRVEGGGVLQLTDGTSVTLVI